MISALAIKRGEFEVSSYPLGWLRPGASVSSAAMVRYKPIALAIC